MFILVNNCQKEQGATLCALHLIHAQPKGKDALQREKLSLSSSGMSFLKKNICLFDYAARQKGQSVQMRAGALGGQRPQNPQLELDSCEGPDMGVGNPAESSARAECLPNH